MSTQPLSKGCFPQNYFQISKMSGNDDVWTTEQFNLKVLALRKRAEDEGMDEKQITDCIEQSLVELTNPESTRLEPGKRYNRGPRYSPIRLMVFCFLLCGVTVLFLIGTRTGQDALDKALPKSILVPISYAVFRFVRLSACPFHGTFDLTKYYSKECIIENPLFVPMEADCDLCNSHKSVKELKTKTDTVKTHLLSFPLIHRGTQTPVHLKDIQQLIEEHKSTLQGQTIDCTVSWVRFVTDLARDDLLDKIKKDDAFSCTWESKHRMFLSQLMRRLFPRPSFISSELEVALEKHVLIDGSGSSFRNLPISVMGGYTWYAQGTGNRTIVFSAHSECQKTCESFQITVREGDILTFPSDRWIVEQMDNGEEISIAFVGQIMP